MLKRTKTFLSILLNVILPGVAMILGIVICVTLLPVKSNYKIYYVISGSMEPTIKTGSLIIVQPKESYKEGDVVSFRSGRGSVTTHRIISRESKGDQVFYKTKGDANNVADTLTIDASKIEGRYLHTIPLLGSIFSYFKSFQGFIILFIVPATIIIYEEIRKIIKEVRDLGQRSKVVQQLVSITKYSKRKAGCCKVIDI